MNRREAHPNPTIVKWARVSINCSVELASRKLGISEQDLLFIENGDMKPSFSQLRKISSLYKRPLSVLYLPEKPKDFIPMRDFRKMQATNEPYSMELCLMIRDTQEKIFALDEIMDSEEEDELDFIGSFSSNDDSIVIAENIREKLEIDSNDFSPSKEAALNNWIDKVENIGIFVFQAGNAKGKKISLKEARGFAIVNKNAPFIFINEQDAKSARIFTLIHELAHLWINESGVSNIGFRNMEYDDYDPIEVKCNKIAANVLLPKELFIQAIEQRYGDSFDENSIVNYLSNKYKLSRTMIARRLLEFNYITSKRYAEMTEVYKEEWEKMKVIYEKKEGKSFGPSPYLMKTIHNGKSLTKYVLSMYQSQRISSSTASELLGTKINKFQDLAVKGLGEKNAVLP
jgi:Zn-dependent peptidase ImmA (M78 family)/DNA-binding XRE family transcriptional regulator